MPAQYHINHEDEFVAIRLDGDVDLVDVYELCQTLLSDPDFNPNLPQLADMRSVNSKLTPGAMRQFLNYVTIEVSAARCGADRRRAGRFDGR